MLGTMKKLNKIQRKKDHILKVTEIQEGRLHHYISPCKHYYAKLTINNRVN